MPRKKQLSSQKGQNMPIEKRIWEAIKKLCFFQKGKLWKIAYSKGLTALQLNILFMLSSVPQKFRTVSFLSSELEVAKPTISVAVRKLEDKGYIRRKENKKDRRVVFLELTAKARKILQPAEDVSKFIEDVIADFPEEDKKKVYGMLVDTIFELQKHNFLKMTRMCISCVNFIPNYKDGKHYCRLIDKYFTSEEVGVDCDYFKPA